MNSSSGDRAVGDDAKSGRICEIMQDCLFLKKTTILHAWTDLKRTYFSTIAI